jgi:asparagine synthase (glutamine-hydrolysing)
VGTSLSGGIDSAAIAAIICRETTYTKSFSAVFPGFEKDESANIELTSGFLNLANYQTKPNATGLLTDFEKLCQHQEQPFGSASIFAQYKVFELAAAQQVTVLLDGQGADETLAGYHRYIHWYLQQLWRQDKAAFAEERQALLQNKIPFHWGMPNKLAAFFPKLAAGQLVRQAHNQQRHQAGIAKDFFEHSYLTGTVQKPVVKGLNDILYYDTVQMGLENLLRYADRNSMAHGREVRLPFLSHHLVEWVFALPPQYKIYKGFTKWILRKAINGKLPPPIIWQTNKTGFEPPQQQWMQDAYIQQLVQGAKEKLVQTGILQPSVLQKKVQPKAAHEADNFDWRYLCAAHTVLT